MSIAVAVDIFSYQMSGLDIIINNACMMLSFSQLDNQFNHLCICFIKLQRHCCKKRKISPEITLSQIQNDHKIYTQNISDKSPNATPLPQKTKEFTNSEIP